MDESLAGAGAEEMTKAVHTKNQLHLWDDIMSIRMVLQSVCFLCHYMTNTIQHDNHMIQSVNRAARLPQGTRVKEFGTRSTGIKSALADVADAVQGSIDSIPHAFMLNTCLYLFQYLYLSFVTLSIFGNVARRIVP